jgi:hypothetical protein
MNCSRVTLAVLFDTDEDYLARIFGFGISPTYEEVMEWFQRLPTADKCLQWVHIAGPMTVEAMKKVALTKRDGQGRQVDRFYCDYMPSRNINGDFGHCVVLERDHQAVHGLGLHDYRGRLRLKDGASDWSTELGGHPDALPPGQLYRVLDQEVTEEIERGESEITFLYWLHNPTAARDWMRINKHKVDLELHAR